MSKWYTGEERFISGPTDNLLNILENMNDHCKKVPCSIEIWILIRKTKLIFFYTCCNKNYYYYYYFIKTALKMYDLSYQHFIDVLCVTLAKNRAQLRWNMLLLYAELPNRIYFLYSYLYYKCKHLITVMVLIKHFINMVHLLY